MSTVKKFSFKYKSGKYPDDGDISKLVVKATVPQGKLEIMMEACPVRHEDGLESYIKLNGKELNWGRLEEKLDCELEMPDFGMTGKGGRADELFLKGMKRHGVKWLEAWWKKVSRGLETK